ncbi:phage portal protein [Streptomyces sp. P9(2023)]|uniref:phage portal protein n=1 Tax=Streptomyces sp. P9(2023) TaxID=3064394 RepID=UPI0028F40B92|nr:phage portal protein [Streptomyces sp. P9(2023)]MDT9689394.1 phage portal protein [Streptomyces sp. P9(2023)]
MSLFFRERRGPFAEPEIPRPSSTASTFASVNLSRTESSLQKVAVWSAVNLISSLTATLPVDVYEGQGAARRQLPLPKVLVDPAGDGYGRVDWTYQYMLSLLLRGNTNGNVADRDRMGHPTQIVLYHPDEVQGWRDQKSGLPQWRVGGESIDADDMWHQRAYSVPGRLQGLSPVAFHAQTIGLGIAALRFGVQWFEDGAHPSGLLTNDNALDAKQAKTAKDRFMAALRGSREPVVLGQGWKYQQIQVAPEESQFLETQKYTSAECARIYGPGMPEILGYDTGGSMTYANVEQRSLDLLTYTLDPWLVRTEDMWSSLLPGAQYAKINRAALARTDLLTRYRAHAIALQNRWEVVNEVRDIEDMQPVAWGDVPSEAQPPKVRIDD